MSPAAKEDGVEERREGKKTLDYNSHKPLGEAEPHRLEGPCPRAWCRVLVGSGKRIVWVGGGWEHESCPSNLSSPGYLLLGLLAMLLTVETFSELPQVRAMVKFFGSSGPVNAEDEGAILGQDELALSNMPPSAAAPAQAPAC